MCGEGWDDRGKMNQHKLTRNKVTPWELQFQILKMKKPSDQGYLGMNTGSDAPGIVTEEYFSHHG